MESLLFLQKYQKFQKLCCLVLATWSQVNLVVFLQSRAYTKGFCNSLVGQCPSCEKDLENFPKFWVFTVLATRFGDLFATWFSRKKCVFCALRTVFKNFQFSLEYFLLFIVLFIHLSPKTSLVLHHLIFNLHEKVWVFLFSLSISCLFPWFLGLLSYCWDLRYMMFEYGLGLFLWVWLTGFSWLW